MPHINLAVGAVPAAASTALVVIGGDPLQPLAVAGAPPDAFVIAADSGLDNARAAGLAPDLVVGDFDSVSAAGQAWARDHRIPTEEHSPIKDSTDTELALSAAVDRGLTAIVMLSGGGDRLDHSLAAVTALGHASLAACRSLIAHWGDSLVHVLHGPRDLTLVLDAGATFSVLALHGRCTGVGVSGAEWPLDGAVIEPGSSLGISNLATGIVNFTVASGVLTIIVPHHFAAVPGSDRHSPETGHP